MLHEIAQELRLVQRVREPTHSRSNLLDFVLTDMAYMTVAQVQAPLADHHVVTPIDRWVWDWKMANWSGLQTEMANFYWDNH